VLGNQFPFETDQQLMLLVQADDTDAFAALHDRLVRRALFVAHAMNVQDDRVEDVVQEAFLSVWRARSTYRADRGRVHAWVLAIVRHRAIDSLRQHGRHDCVRKNCDELLAAVPSLTDVEADGVERGDAHALRLVLAGLPLAQREVIALAYYGKLTHTEIAGVLSLPLGTIKGRMRLGLTRLRERVAA
jgi:RNA polymerase sigma-70 factor (ECF subfamily)